MTCAVGTGTQLIRVSYGAEEYTWPATVYELTGQDISADPVTVAIVAAGDNPEGQFVAPTLPVVRGTMNVATFKWMFPALVPQLSPTLSDTDLIYFATVQMLITATSNPPGNWDEWIQVGDISETVPRYATGFQTR